MPASTPLTCPSCSTELRAPYSMAGRTAKCRKCGASLPIADADSTLEELRKAAIAKRGLEQKTAAEPESDFPGPPELTRANQYRLLSFVGVVALVVLAIIGSAFRSSIERVKPPEAQPEVAGAPDFAEEHERLRKAIQESKDAQRTARFVEEEAYKAKFDAKVAQEEAETVIKQAEQSREAAELAERKARAGIDGLKEIERGNTAAVAILTRAKQEDEERERQARVDKARERVLRSERAKKRYLEAYLQAPLQEQRRMDEGKKWVIILDDVPRGFDSPNVDRVLILKMLNDYYSDIILSSGRTGAELKEVILSKYVN
jgi:hypothetical protein